MSAAGTATPQQSFLATPAERSALSASSDNALATLAAASTSQPPVMLPSLHDWLTPFGGGVSLMSAHADPTVSVALWHCATQRLISCSANFSLLLERSLTQLQRGFAWTSLFASQEPNAAVEQSRALLAHAMARVGRGHAQDGMAVLMTSLKRNRHNRWLLFEFAPTLHVSHSAATVMTFIREVAPAAEPWVYLPDMEHDDHDKQLVAAPTKRRNGVSHPWDANVMHFRLMATQ